MNIFSNKQIIKIAILILGFSCHSYGANPPTIINVIPSSGFNDLNTTVQISGTNFQSGATVTIGTTSAISITVSSSSMITATVPYGISAGAYDIKVTNSDNQSATLMEGFVVNPVPAEWTTQALAWSGNPTTSTCTIVLSNNTYRNYNPGIWTRTSPEGLTWTDQVSTGINDQGATNPAVIRLKDETYLMIYGIQTHTSGPPTEKLYRATSTDGIHFTKQAGPLTDGAVLTADGSEHNFVSVPDLISIDDDTTLRMYFVADSYQSHIHTAVSIDNGQTWTREGQISITGGPIGQQDVDPDIIKLADGTYRLYFATSPSGETELGNLRIRSAVSNDGRNFTLESGERVSPSVEGAIVIDPDTILLPGTSDKYCFYYGGMNGETPSDLRIAIPQFPDISISPENYDFGNVNTGNSSSPKSFTITNTTDTETALIINMMKIRGVSPSEFRITDENCSGKTLSLNETCTVQVIFSPVSAGTKNAILRIQSNDPDTPTRDIQMNGIGLAEVSCSKWSEVIEKYNSYVAGQTN